MKKFTLFCIIYFWSINTYGQLLEDRTNFYVGYQSGLFIGNELLNDHGTVFPSFYSNLSSNNGLVVKYSFKLSSFLSGGIKLGALNAKNWQSDNYTSYNNSKFTMITFQPIIQVHNKFQETKIFNKLKVYGEISPVLGWSILNIKNNIFDIYGFSINNNTFDDREFVYGIETSIGCEYAFTNKIGVFFNLSAQEEFINSSFFLDDRYTLIGFNLGIKLNISKVKRFNY